MRKFIVNVNGTSYEVEVEEISATEAAGASAAAKSNVKPVQAGPALTGSEKTINAPMPGNILSINVKPGDSFKTGQVLLVLEAMKMENEIMAPSDGKVVAVNVQKGAAVNTGDLLVAYN